MPLVLKRMARAYHCFNLEYYPVVRNVKTLFVCSDLHGIRLLLSIAYFLLSALITQSYDEIILFGYIGHIIQITGSKFLVYLLMTAGITQLYILLSGTINSRCAVIFSGVAALAWWFLAISLYLEVPGSLVGKACSITLAFGSSWVFLRSGFPIIDRRKANRDYGPI